MSSPQRVYSNSNFKVQKLWLLFNCWSNNDSNKHVSLHANYPLSIVCPLCGRDIPSLEGLGEAFFTSTGSLVHLLPIMSMKSVFFEDYKPRQEGKITPGERALLSHIKSFCWSQKNCVKRLAKNIHIVKKSRPWIFLFLHDFQYHPRQKLAFFLFLKKMYFIPKL